MISRKKLKGQFLVEAEGQLEQLKELDLQMPKPDLTLIEEIVLCLH